MELNKFTILNLNGEAKYVSAIYDGSGNVITEIYETKADSTLKNDNINTRIDTIQKGVQALENRVSDVEAFGDRIKTNEDSINSCLADIKKLDEKYTGLNDDLTGVGSDVNTNTNDIGDLKNEVLSLKELLGTLQTTVSSLKAIIEDETSGIQVLNDLVNQNIADIAALQNRSV